MYSYNYLAPSWFSVEYVPLSFPWRPSSSTSLLIDVLLLVSLLSWNSLYLQFVLFFQFSLFILVCSCLFNRLCSHLFCSISVITLQDPLIGSIDPSLSLNSHSFGSKCLPLLCESAFHILLSVWTLLELCLLISYLWINY